MYLNDEFVKIYENGEFGKIECWYIIDCEKDVEIIYGYNVKIKEELILMIDFGEWDKFLCWVKVKSGDFFYVLSGIVYVIGKGIFVLEM